MRIYARYFMLLLMIPLLALVALAEPPLFSNYQGRLLDTSGQPISHQVVLELRIFDQPTAGQLLYSEQHIVTPVEGVFSVLIGQGSNPTGRFEPSLFDGAERWLELVVDAEVLEPRQPFGSVAYAFRSTSAEAVGVLTDTEIATQLDLAALQAQIDALQQKLQPLLCGNGTVDPPEECDDGNGMSGDGCTDACILEFCGDGVLQPQLLEECDDGNNLDGDGCSSTCLTEGQVAPDDATFNDPLVIPLDNTISVLDFVSFPGGDREDRVRWDVTGMNSNPSLPGGRARLVISASCFGSNTDQIEFFTGGQTFACGQTLVDREITFDSRTGQVTITAVGGSGTFVQWVLTGTATRLN